MAGPFSIITAVHNGLAINRVFWESLDKNTQTPFELILIDNHSTDGSENLFCDLMAERRGSEHEVVYIRNSRNQSYPASQIQGMALARYNQMAFLNNDIWLPSGWEHPLLKTLGGHRYAVVSPCGQDALPFQDAADRLKRRWKYCTWLSFLWKRMLAKSEQQRLWQSLHWMYRDLERFVAPIPQGSPQSFDGIKGDAVLFSKSLLELEPNPWDPKIEGADWHLYLTMAQHHEKRSDVPLPQVLTASYVHHFGRYSFRQSYEEFSREGFLTIEQVWGQERVDRLWWGRSLPKSAKSF